MGKDGFVFPYFHIGGFSIPSYGIIVAIGFILGTLLCIKRSPRFAFPREDCLYALLFGVVGVVVGGKILYLISDWPRLWENRAFFFETLDGIMILLGGGFVYYGGLFGGLLGAYIYTRMYKLRFYDFLQTVVPVIPLIHGIGRIACFGAGCCYGIPWDLPVGMLFAQSLAAPHDVYLFPVQLLEAGLNFVLFGVLIYMFRRPVRLPAVGVYFLGYGVVRLICEFFRYDEARGFFLGISTSQWISLLVFPLGLVLLYLALRKNPVLGKGAYGTQTASEASSETSPQGSPQSSLQDDAELSMFPSAENNGKTSKK